MRRLIRSWQARVAVEGHSMEPTLRNGDWLLVDPAAYAEQPPAVGELVVAAGPRERDRERCIVKRVAAIDNERDRLTLSGDHPAHADEPELTSLPASSLAGRPWFRYWPPRRIGRLR